MKNSKFKIKNLRLVTVFCAAFVTSYLLLVTSSDVLALAPTTIQNAPTQSVISTPTSTASTSSNNVATAATSGGDLNAWLGTFYIWAVGIGGALAILMIAMAAIDYAASGGDVEKMNGAKEKIVGAVIGLLLLILTYLIVNALHTEAPDTGSTTTTVSPTASGLQRQQQTYEQSQPGVQAADTMITDVMNTLNTSTKK